MRRKLTEQDIKNIKYQCRMGYILPFFFFTLGSIFITALVDFIVSFEREIEGSIHIYLTIGILFIISVLMNYLMNGKYKADLRNKEKILERKTIQKKLATEDVEAGSANVGPLPHNRSMNKFMRYDLIIDNTKYRIDKELFDKCSDGDDVFFHIAPKSKYRIKIDLK
ncbi:hypothetical protein [Labilibaculum sp.]|uniref:hypothetical protein n=1 Tax=Labilibaculum sp. TaxID=2060723 RepID=UPI002AA6D5AA|nr:hypothetical protein [Labilibaculum sp.]